MSGRLAATVAVRHPDSGEAVVFAAGEDPPAWALPLITNPEVWEGEAPAATSGPPPVAGRGSSLEAWAAYAGAHGVVLGDGASRDDIVAACRAAGVPAGH